MENNIIYASMTYIYGIDEGNKTYELELLT